MLTRLMLSLALLPSALTEDLMPASTLPTDELVDTSQASADTDAAVAVVLEELAPQIDQLGADAAAVVSEQLPDLDSAVVADTVVQTLEQAVEDATVAAVEGPAEPAPDEPSMEPAEPDASMAAAEAPPAEPAPEVAPPIDEVRVALEARVSELETELENALAQIGSWPSQLEAEVTARTVGALAERDAAIEELRLERFDAELARVLVREAYRAQAITELGPIDPKSDEGRKAIDDWADAHPEVLARREEPKEAPVKRGPPERGTAWSVLDQAAIERNMRG